MSKVHTVLVKVTYIFTRNCLVDIPENAHGMNSFSRPRITWRPRIDFSAVHCVIRAGDKCEKRNVYSNSKTQDNPTLSARCRGTLLNSARGPVAKWMAMSHDCQPTNLGRRTIPSMHGRNVQDRNWKVRRLKKMEYKVIRGCSVS